MLDGLIGAAESAAAWLASFADVALDRADSPWALVILFAFVTIDGFFPPIPSETLVIALASLSMTGDGPSLWALVPVAAIGAFCGDLLAFAIGRRVPLSSMRIFRSRRGARTLAWAERTLQHRGGVLILSARYIPIGRVAVNMAAGAVGFHRSRFMGLAAIAAVSWAIYTTLLGVGAGVFLTEHPLWAILVGVAVGTVLGTVLDVIIRRFVRPAGPEAEPEPPHSTPSATRSKR